MRILAIRGRNLASLAGDFEILLDAQPLAGAGLFAITGRTGSGKSTILDALCLALFDRMPRLPVGRGVELGRADDAPEIRLRNNDVRWILRRGSGEGYAEVDFLGVDGRRYRARWSVRRARERAGGRFQAQTLALQDLDSGADLSGTKIEVLDAIQARLGLTFDQFRRSALLAQGDFAAFLKADGGERAQLLERITGTGIYGEISKAAHRRAAEEHQRLELLRQRLGDHHPLDAEARQNLEADLVAARQVLDERHRTHRTLEQAQHWYQVLDGLTGELDQAVAQLERARAEQAAAEPRGWEFERIRALQPLRAPLTAFDQAADALAASRQELERSRAELQVRELAVGRSAAEAAACEADCTAAQKAMDDTAPALQEARHLDTRLQSAREHFHRAVNERDAADKSLQEVKKEQEGLQTQADRIARASEQAKDWLADHAGIEPLAAQWEAWARELGRYAREREALVKARADIEAAGRADAGLAEQSRDQGALIAQISADRERAAAERTELEGRAAVFDLDGLAVRREEGLARRDRIEQWRRLAERAQEGGAHLEEIRNGLAREQTRQAKSDARLSEIEAEIVPLAAALTEAEAAHHRLLLAGAGEVQVLRAQLQDGQPCPVCGAERHPWAQGAGPALAGLAEEQAARVAALKYRSQQVGAEKARGLAESGQAAQRAADLASQAEAQQALMDRVLETWSACDDDALRPADPCQDGLVERQGQALEALAGALRRIAEDETKARALQAELRAKTAEIEVLDSRLNTQQSKLADLKEQSRSATDARERAKLEHARAQEAMGQVLELVAVPLAGIDDWRVRLAADPQEFVDACRHRIEAWRLRIEQRDEVDRSRQDLAPRLAQAQARRQGAEEGLARCIAAVEQHSTALEVLERGRAALLEGRSVDAVEADLGAALVQAQQRRDRSRVSLAGAREALTEAQGVVATRQQALRARETVAAMAQTDLDRKMVASGVSLDTLREALTRDQEWLERERQVLEVLRQACGNAQALVRERERRVDEHRAAQPPALSRDAVAQRLLLAAESVGTAQEHWGRLHGRLEEDERRRAAGLEIQAELDRQQAAWELWESLRGLIGSADGARFRNFAQGLTLDLLVAYANSHLRDLVRRYELQRVPGAEMEIQVIDREMGDEVRSVHSLSGGESFLVSLALALALASLASDRVEVESLFIDEGFGALDADSLDLAIASLDALYGLGRQVGVISHVGTLVERIGVKVQVTKQGGGRSRLEVVAD